MKSIPKKEFLNWAKSKGIIPDPRYEEPKCLVYADLENIDRSWETPVYRPEKERFATALLRSLGQWSIIWIWPRGGYWQTPEELNDEERTAFYALIGLPMGYEGGVELSIDQFDLASFISKKSSSLREVALSYRSINSI